MLSRNLTDLIVIGTFIVCIFMVYSLSTLSVKFCTEEESSPSADIINKLIEQRNNITRMLNSKQQLIGQIVCEKALDSDKSTSETGGWCRNESSEVGGGHVTDRKLAKVLATFFSDKHVGSFGDGPGRYKQLLLDSGKVKGYDAYDGAPFCDVTSDGRVQFLDLTLPQYGLPLYDWIISVEVAEHIPSQYESIYIDNIVRHAREGVVLSWAVPGQGGLSHVNSRPFEYVKGLFDTLGFSLDKMESQKLKSAATHSWLRKNINVFRRRDLSKADGLKPFFI